MYVDLDITQQNELEYIREQSLAINTVISYHNYQETPDTEQLDAIIATIKHYQPAIYKLSTLCKEPEDGLRLMHLLLKLNEKNIPAIVSGMGEHGKLVKIFGALYGNIMTFAPQTKEEQSAPNQLTREQFEIIFQQLET